MRKKDICLRPVLFPWERRRKNATEFPVRSRGDACFFIGPPEASYFLFGMNWGQAGSLAVDGNFTRSFGLAQEKSFQDAQSPQTLSPSARISSTGFFGISYLPVQTWLKSSFIALTK